MFKILQESIEYTLYKFYIVHFGYDAILLGHNPKNIKIYDDTNQFNLFRASWMEEFVEFV